MQRFEYTTNDPPELIHVIAICGTFQCLNDARQRAQMLFRIRTFDPAQQCKLEFWSELGGDYYRVFASRLAISSAVELMLRRQIQQQQGALRQQWLSPRRAQVIQHRQQHQRDIATTP